MKRWLVLLSILLIGFALYQLATNFLRRTTSLSARPVEITKEATTSSTEIGKTGEEAVVRRVIDGDTVELVNGQRVRYIGIDTPELVHPQKPVECFGREAKAENQQLIEGKMVRMEKDISETDKYGRLLRYIYIGDTFVNEYLVRQGFAFASTYPPDVRYSKQFIAAQKEARENNRGLWGSCPG